MLPISLLAMAIGVVCAYVALALLRLIFTSGDLHQWIGQRDSIEASTALGKLARRNVLSASPDEPLRAAVHRMAENGVTRLPVLEAATRKFLGILSLDDLLKARSRHLEEERRREKTLGFGSLSFN